MLAADAVVDQVFAGMSHTIRTELPVTERTTI
jgi:hypothetical protein